MENKQKRELTPNEQQVGAEVLTAIVKGLQTGERIQMPPGITAHIHGTKAVQGWYVGPDMPEAEPGAWCVVSEGNDWVTCASAEKGVFPRYEVDWDRDADPFEEDWQATYYPAPGVDGDLADVKNGLDGSSIHFDSLGGAVAYCLFHTEHGRWPGFVPTEKVGGSVLGYRECNAPEFAKYTEIGEAVAGRLLGEPA